MDKAFIKDDILTSPAACRFEKADELKRDLKKAQALEKAFNKDRSAPKDGEREDEESSSEEDEDKIAEEKEAGVSWLAVCPQVCQTHAADPIARHEGELQGRSSLADGCEASHSAVSAAHLVCPAKAEGLQQPSHALRTLCCQLASFAEPGLCQPV